MEVQRKNSIDKAKNGEDAKMAGRTRSGSTSEHGHQKKKASAMQKTYLEDAYLNIPL